jgi:hypothetical protein
MKKFKARFPDGRGGYTFLADEPLAATLQPGDSVLADTARGTQEVIIEQETDEPLLDHINYRHILQKVETTDE